MIGPVGLLVVALQVTQPLQPVAPVPDTVSWGVAAIDPVWSAVAAWRGPSRGCALVRLGVAEAVGNGVALLVKSRVRSARPCTGCPADGMPSAHTMNGMIGTGLGTPVGWGLGLGVGTGALRVLAHRHTWPQVVAGLGLGLGADLAGSLVRCHP